MFSYQACPPTEPSMQQSAATRFGLGEESKTPAASLGIGLRGGGVGFLVQLSHLVAVHLFGLMFLRFPSHRSADPAEFRLPAGGPGAGQPGGAAGRPLHLHVKVHRETVQPDRRLLHHDDR